jgi:hypothetical protein
VFRIRSAGVKLSHISSFMCSVLHVWSFWTFHDDALGSEVDDISQPVVIPGRDAPLTVKTSVCMCLQLIMSLSINFRASNLAKYFAKEDLDFDVMAILYHM